MGDLLSMWMDRLLQRLAKWVTALRPNISISEVLPKASYLNSEISPFIYFHPYPPETEVMQKPWSRTLM
jgi:hypothetical protein